MELQWHETTHIHVFVDEAEALICAKAGDVVAISLDTEPQLTHQANVDVSVGCHECCMWGHHSWSLQGTGDFPPGAWQWKTPDVILMKIFGLTNKSDRMSTKNNQFHGCYFVFLCICGNIRNKKCTVIGQARFHFTYFFFYIHWLFSTNIRFFFIKP